MKLLLIMPDAHMHKLRIGPLVRSMREAPLTLTTLAALTRRDSTIDMHLVDESVQRVPLGYRADIVGISAITGCASRAYELARHFRDRGIPVVLGGIHVTILPDEAKAHADAIVIGPAERTWPRLIADFRAGQLKPVYRDADSDADDDPLSGIPPPRRDLQRNWAYNVPNTVQATRGCKRACDFCTVPVVWPRQYLLRPVGDVIADIKTTRGKLLAFNDVSLVDDPAYAEELFTAMIPLKKRWGGLVTADIMRRPHLVELMAQSGCVYLLIGFESVNGSSLCRISKGFNKPERYKDLMQLLHQWGISVQGCFVFGFDEDEEDVFAATVERVNELKIDIPRYSLYTPYPGTRLFRRLMAEERILSYNWNDYDTMHVVIRPKLMTPDELYAGFKWAYKKTFTIRNIARRLDGLTFNTAVNFAGNLTYRIFVKRLYTEARFATPYSVDAPGEPPASLLGEPPSIRKEPSCLA